MTDETGSGTKAPGVRTYSWNRKPSPAFAIYLALSPIHPRASGSEPPLLSSALSFFLSFVGDQGPTPALPAPTSRKCVSRELRGGFASPALWRQVAMVTRALGLMTLRHVRQRFAVTMKTCPQELIFGYIYYLSRSLSLSPIVSRWRSKVVDPFKSTWNTNFKRGFIT